MTVNLKNPTILKQRQLLPAPEEEGRVDKVVITPISSEYLPGEVCLYIFSSILIICDSLWPGAQ